MGSWSATIMGGDGPLDAQYEILKLIGFDKKDGQRDYSDYLPEIKGLFEQVNLSTWKTFIGNSDSDYTDDKTRALVFMIMECGAALPAHLAHAAIEVCADEIEEGCSIWDDPSERRGYLQQFIDTIGQYDGTPTQLPAEGLFDKLAEYLKPKPSMG